MEGGLGHLFTLGGVFESEVVEASRIGPPGSSDGEAGIVGIGIVEKSATLSVVKHGHALHDGINVVSRAGVEELEEAKTTGIGAGVGAPTFLRSASDDGLRPVAGLQPAKGSGVQLARRAVLAVGLGAGRLGGDGAIHGQGHEEGGDDAELGGSGGELHLGCYA